MAIMLWVLIFVQKSLLPLVTEAAYPKLFRKEQRPLLSYVLRHATAAAECKSHMPASVVSMSM